MKKLFFILCVWFFSTLILFADDNSDELNKISKQLDSIKTLYENGILEKKEYENSKTKLLKRKASLQPKTASTKKKKKIY